MTIINTASHPLVNFSEFKYIGQLARVPVYQTHNKNLTAMGPYAMQVPTLEESNLWCCTLQHVAHAVRPVFALERALQGHAVLWRRSHRLCDIGQAVAALLMLHDVVVIIRSFDQGEKL